MTLSIGRMAGALACLAATCPLSAEAHGIAGARLFPATLTVDDPAASDELSLPTFTYQPGADGTHSYGYGMEWSKTILPGFAISFDESYSVLHQPGDLGGNLYGWSNPGVTLKYEFFESDPHEILAAIGITKEFGGVGAVDHGFAEAAGSTEPTLYLGKGLGDLPASLGFLRPFAVTGTVGYQWADEPNSIAPDGSIAHTPDFWNLGFTLQYDMAYLRSQVKDYGLPEFINHLIPIVEFAYSTPASGSHEGTTTIGTIAPGILYEAGRSFQIGIEALIPATRASGNQVGVIAQIHFYLDDLLPTTLGRSIF